MVTWNAKMIVTSLSGKRVLMVLAHCDDEIICGWPIFQLQEVKKTILIASSDRHNSSRVWCAHRKFIFKKICKEFHVAGHCLDYDSEFSRLPHRNGDLKKFQRELLIKIDSLRPFDYVFCHNPFGEYGHSDHKFLFDTILHFVPEPMLISDIFMKSDWTELDTPSARAQRLFYGNKICQIFRNKSIYDAVEDEYRRNDVWTWNQAPAEVSGIYLID
jgi:LmbE family N-acetylglucosaminyl deacetylase